MVNIKKKIKNDKYCLLLILFSIFQNVMSLIVISKYLKSQSKHNKHYQHATTGATCI